MPDQKGQTSAEPAYITRQEAADLLKQNIRTIDRHIRAGILRVKRPKVRRGRAPIRVLVRAEDVRKLAAEENGD